ncbi:MAG: hypothetical protein U0869_17780 [Chloroflexota bacterium]
MTEASGPRRPWAATRAALDAFATDYPDPLPEDLRGDLPALGWATDQLHYPADPESRDRARQRPAFEELLALRGRHGRAAAPAGGRGRAAHRGQRDAEWASAIGGVEQGIAVRSCPPRTVRAPSASR